MFFTKSRIFLAVCFSSSLGLAFGLSVSMVVVLSICILAVILISIFWQFRSIRVLGCSGLVLAVSLYYSNRQQPVDLSEYYEKKIDVRMVITEDPNIDGQKMSFLARSSEVAGKSTSAVIYISLPRYPTYEYGTELLVNGKLQEPKEFLMRTNASGIMSSPKVSEARPGKGNVIKENLFKLKHTILLRIGRIIPEPQAGLLGGLLLGTRGLRDDLAEKFRLTGTSHIIAVSGSNVTIVAVFLDKLLRRFGRSVSFYGSLAGITGFVLITGATAAVVRAGLMGGLVLVAANSGRLFSSVNALALAATTMLWQNPKIFLYDIGFQLSFSAFAGILFVQPFLEERFPNAPGAIKNFLFPTLAAQATTSPVILYHFGNFSIISALTNMLVLPFISFAMLFGFLALFIPFVPYIAWLVLAYIIKMIELTASIPGAGLSNLKFPLWALIIYYLVLLTILLWKPKPKVS